MLSRWNTLRRSTLTGAIAFISCDLMAHSQVEFSSGHSLKATSVNQHLAPGEVFEVCVAGRYERSFRKYATSTFVFLKLSNDALEQDGEVLTVFVETDQLSGRRALKSQQLRDLQGEIGRAHV